MMRMSIFIFLIVVVVVIIILVIRSRRKKSKPYALQNSDILDDPVSVSAAGDAADPDIFISYAREDREPARIIAAKLEEMQFDVFWDREITPGKSFDEVIEQKLDVSKCVIVLWSKSSVTSRWVKSEASEALNRDVLIPIMLEEVKIPLEFRNIQAASIEKLSPEAIGSEMQRLRPVIEGLLAK